MISLKPAAMLSSGLLARKGAAVPASLAVSPHAVVTQVLMAEDQSPRPASALSLGMQPATPAPLPAPRIELRSPAPRPVEVPPREAGKDGTARGSLVQLAGGKPPAGPAGTVKVSLRLDPERHLKLRLAAVHRCSSGQQILIEALDAWLERQGAALREGGCVCLKPARPR
jgi:hypothetical protein